MAFVHLVLKLYYQQVLVHARAMRRFRRFLRFRKAFHVQPHFSILKLLIQIDNVSIVFIVLRAGLVIIWRVLLRGDRDGQLHRCLLFYIIIKQKLLLRERSGVMTAAPRSLFLGRLPLELAVLTFPRS